MGTSFDVAVRHAYADSEFVYICITRENAKHNKFKILPKHPLSIEECTLLEYDEGFSKIDWPVLTKKGLIDEYAKHVKMAECLTELRVPAKLLWCCVPLLQEVDYGAVYYEVV